MPRVVIPLQEIGANGSGIDSISFTAADAANDHYFDNTSEQVLLLVKCTDATPKVTSGMSVADILGRTGDKTITTPATTGLSIYGPFPAGGFNQRGAADLGKVFVDLVTATGVSYAALKVTPAK